MATPRTTFVLLILALLGGGWLYFFDARFESTVQSRESERRVLHLHADQISTIALKRDAFTNGTVERIDATTFKRTAPEAGAADSALIAEICSDLEFGDHVTVLAHAADDAQRLFEEGLTPPQLSVTLTLADRREIAFELGKETASHDGVYLRLRDAADVQVVPVAWRERLDRLLDLLNDVTPKSDDNAKPGANPTPKGDGG